MEYKRAIGETTSDSPWMGWGVRNIAILQEHAEQLTRQSLHYILAGCVQRLRDAKLRPEHIAAPAHAASLVLTAATDIEAFREARTCLHNCLRVYDWANPESAIAASSAMMEEARQQYFIIHATLNRKPGTIGSYREYLALTSGEYVQLGDWESQTALYFVDWRVVRKVSSFLARPFIKRVIVQHGGEPYAEIWGTEDLNRGEYARYYRLR